MFVGYLLVRHMATRHVLRDTSCDSEVLCCWGFQNRPAVILALISPRGELRSYSVPSEERMGWLWRDLMQYRFP
jgi:hypothetical protein